MTTNPTQLALACYYYTTTYEKSGDGLDLMEYLESRSESIEKLGKLEDLLLSICRSVDALKVRNWCNY